MTGPGTGRSRHSQILPRARTRRIMALSIDCSMRGGDPLTPAGDGISHATPCKVSQERLRLAPRGNSALFMIETPDEPPCGQ